MIKKFYAISKEIVKCSDKQQCCKECSSMDTDSPQPGFIGRNYQGIVIIGANPGTGGEREYYQQMNRKYYAMADSFANSNDISDYHKYLDFSADYMQSWNQHLCNNKFRDFLDYDIEDIAYINIVKCRTTQTSSDVFANCGATVTYRCAEQYLLRQLDILKPKYIVGHWKTIGNTLERLGYDLSHIDYASYSGQRNLPVVKRIKDVQDLFNKAATLKTGT